MAQLNLVQAINQALMQEMARDKTVLVLGEDVGADGGVFRVTEGLLKKFGENRVIDTPLAEVGIIGASIGLAINGFRPVCEAQFDGFSLAMLDQLINHASRMRTRTRGRLTVPLVLRFPYGGGVRALEHHSDSPEIHYAHTPGLKVVIPSNPYDAKGLLASAIRDPDPVIFMEPKRVYRSIKNEVPEEIYAIQLGEANIAREGNDATLITYGAMVKVCSEAVAKSGVDAEIVDLRTISPLDEDTIVKSIGKTGRAIIVQEAPKSIGFGAEILSVINEKAFLNLEAPVIRVAGWDVVTPLPKLENYFFPDVERVMKALKKIAEY
ncbi:MAG TPA: alpha-ketoacid dehydrogenase subunit beta [archaeon]|nr:alpha-ketoacid dehydrogenase subunit beta [archaeon]